MTRKFLTLLALVPAGAWAHPGHSHVGADHPDPLAGLLLLVVLAGGAFWALRRGRGRK